MKENNSYKSKKIWKLQKSKRENSSVSNSILFVQEKIYPGLSDFRAALAAGAVSAEGFARCRDATRQAWRCIGVVWVHLPSNLSVNSIRRRRVVVHLTLPPMFFSRRVGSWRLNLKMNHHKIANRAWKLFHQPPLSFRDSTGSQKATLLPTGSWWKWHVKTAWHLSMGLSNTNLTWKLGHLLWSFVSMCFVNAKWWISVCWKKNGWHVCFSADVQVDKLLWFRRLTKWVLSLTE